MPIIKEQDLLELHDKIKKLEADKERVELLQEKQVKKLTKKATKNKRSFVVTFVFLLLSIAASIALFFWFNKAKGGEEKIKIVEKKVFVKEETEKDLLYKIQIRALKDVSVDFENVVKHYSNATSGFHEYSIGSFDSYMEASNFVRKLDLLGFKDAYIIAFYKGNKIDVRDALDMQLGSGDSESEQEKLEAENLNENDSVTNSEIIE